jgi:hypothetical protein
MTSNYLWRGDYFTNTADENRLSDCLNKEVMGDISLFSPSLTPKLSDLRLDGGTQPRIELNPEVIAEYAELLCNDIKFPPITAYFDGVSYWLADGFHRYWAAYEAKVELEINVINGTQRDAILHSVGANATHGLRRSNQDKRKAVTTLLQDNEWSQWSDRAIARQCQVTQPFVSKLRKKLSDNRYQMAKNHTRKVKRGEQVYEQRQRNPLKMKASQKQEPSHPSHPKKSVIPEIRPDVHEAICQFLNLEVEAPPEGSYQQDDRAYLIVSHDPDEMDLSLERLFSQLEGEKIQNAIAVTPNQAGPQNQIKEKASAVCLISNSQCLCHRVVWYFGKQRHRFFSTFNPFGLVFLFDDEQVQV